MTMDLQKQVQEKRARLQQFVGRGPNESSTRGINHLAVFAQDLEDTAEFYTQVLGMPVTGVTSNRDEPRSTHMNVEIGGGMALSFFGFPHVPRLQEPAQEGAGGMTHVAIDISAEKYAQIESQLKERRVSFRKIGNSVYFNDPNGMTIELGIVQA